MEGYNFAGYDFEDNGRSYRLTPIQQPLRSASFEDRYLSRLPLSPPLILQLDCWDADQQLVIPYDELPFLVCNISLQTKDGHDATMVLDPASGEAVSMIYGGLVATAAEMVDQSGSPGIYFVFPDVSVRFVGTFRIEANVLRMTSGRSLDTCYTDPFDIVRDIDYVAPSVTDLTRHFDAQGVVNMGLRGY